MVMFKAKLWKVGNSKVITVPAVLYGKEVELGSEVLVELLPPDHNGQHGILTPNLQESLIHSFTPGILA